MENHCRLRTIGPRPVWLVTKTHPQPFATPNSSMIGPISMAVRPGVDAGTQRSQLVGWEMGVSPHVK